MLKVVYAEHILSIDFLATPTNDSTVVSILKIIEIRHVYFDKKCWALES